MAGVVAGAVVVPAPEPPESEPPESPPVSPPDVPNCGGVIETTAPRPPRVPPTISAKRLESMELELLCVYSVLWDSGILCRLEYALN